MRILLATVLSCMASSPVRAASRQAAVHVDLRLPLAADARVAQISPVPASLAFLPGLPGLEASVVPEDSIHAAQASPEKAPLAAALTVLTAQKPEDAPAAAGRAFDGSRASAAGAGVIGRVAGAYRRIFATPPRVPFQPTAGAHYYHGTSWADVLDVVGSGGALSARTSFLARAHHHSEPYADARARAKESKSIVLEFEDEPIDALSSFSGSPGGQYPAYRAHSPVPLRLLTPASKKAVLDEHDRQQGSAELRRALERALGL